MSQLSLHDLGQTPDEATVPTREYRNGGDRNKCQYRKLPWYPKHINQYANSLDQGSQKDIHIVRDLITDKGCITWYWRKQEAKNEGMNQNRRREKGKNVQVKARKGF